MNKPKAVFAKLIIGYLIAMLLISFVAGRCGIVIRQYLRVAGKVAAVIGAAFLANTARDLIPSEKRFFRAAVSVIIVIAVIAVLLMMFLLESDRESVVVMDGRKKVRVESSFLMFLEVSYHDYGNALWYRRYPCVIESYDDGDPDQLAYTDIYDENGTLTERIFARREE